MKVTRPYPGTEIVVVEDLATPEETEILAAYGIAYYQKLRNVDGLEWRASPPGRPLPHGYSNSVESTGPEESFGDADIDLKERVQEITQSIEMRAKEVMEKEFPWIGKPRYTPFGELILRAPGDYMKPHYDGVPGVGADYQPPNLGSIFYITGDLDGGETCYPHFEICYKPTPGSFIIHPGEPEYLHEVAQVKSGWRITMNLFAIKDNEHSLKVFEESQAKLGLNK